MGSKNSKSKQVLPKLNISVIGPPNSGKTYLIQKICTGKTSDEFQDHQTFTSKIVNKKLDLVFTDSPGSFEYRDLLHYYIKGADTILLVFSVENSPNDIIRFLGQVNKNNKYCRKIMVCNKNDLEDFREVNNERIQELKEEYGYEIIYVSVKHNININKLKKRISDDKEEKPEIKKTTKFFYG